MASKKLKVPFFSGRIRVGGGWGLLDPNPGTGVVSRGAPPRGSSAFVSASGDFPSSPGSGFPDKKSWWVRTFHGWTWLVEFGRGLKPKQGMDGNKTPRKKGLNSRCFKADFWMDLVTKSRTKYDKDNTLVIWTTPETDPRTLKLTQGPEKPKVYQQSDDFKVPPHLHAQKKSWIIYCTVNSSEIRRENHVGFVFETVVNNVINHQPVTGLKTPDVWTKKTIFPLHPCCFSPIAFPKNYYFCCLRVVLRIIWWESFGNFAGPEHHDSPTPFICSKKKEV